MPNIDKNSTSNESIIHGPNEQLPHCVHLTRYFEAQLKKSPDVSDQPALVAIDDTDSGQNSQLTFQDFLAQYKSLSHELKELVKNSSPFESAADRQQPMIGLSISPSIQLAVAAYAVLDAEFGFVPLDAQQPGDRLYGIIKSSNVQIILTDQFDGLQEKFKQHNIDKTAQHEHNLQWANPNYLKKFIESIDVPLYDIKSLIQLSPTKQREIPNANDDSKNEVKKFDSKQLAAVLFTSGSTGIAKGVPIRHASFMNMMNFRRHEMPFGKNEMGLMKSAFTFIDGIIELFEALLQLRPLLILPKSVTINPNAFLSAISHYPIERMALVPSHMLTIVQSLDSAANESAKSIEKACQQIKLVILDGEELTSKLVEQIFNLFPSAAVYNIYGTTETCGDNTYVRFESIDDVRSVERGQEHALPVGKVCDNFNLYILNGDEEAANSPLKPMPLDKIGEVYFSGIGVAENYVGIDTGRFVRNHLSKDNDHNVLYKTGDLGFIDSKNSMLYLAGRSDDLAKIRGQRIHLSELNAAASTVQNVTECASLIDKAYTTQRLVTFFVCRSTDAKSVDDAHKQIQQAMERKLPSYAIPVLVHYAADSTLPRLPNGKINRKALLEYYHENVAKPDPNDKSLLGIISYNLGVPKNQLKMSKSFAENGGNSLNTVVAVTELNNHGYNIELASFLELKSLDELAAQYSNQPNTTHGKAKKLLRAHLPEEYKFVELSEVSAEEGSNFISKGNIEFGELEHYLTDVIDQKHIANCIAQLWPQFLDHDLSLGIRRRDDPNGPLVALIVGCDENKPIDFAALNGPYFDVLEELLGNPEADVIVRDISRDPGEMVAGFALNVQRDLDEAEKVKLFYLLQVEEIRRAKAKGYKYIIGGDTSPVTQGVGKLLGYKTLQTVRINQLTKRDGSRPFAAAPDDHVTTLDVLYLDEIEIE